MGTSYYYHSPNLLMPKWPKPWGPKVLMPKWLKPRKHEWWKKSGKFQKHGLFQRSHPLKHILFHLRSVIRIHLLIPNFYFGTTRRWYVVDVIKIFLLVLKSQFN